MAVLPAATVTLGFCAVICSIASICVGSLAVSFEVSVSPPPETVAVFVTVDAALFPTFTVMVMGSKLVPANSVSPRVQPRGWSVQFQKGPLMSVAVSPAGRASLTLMIAVVSAPPVPLSIKVMIIQNFRKPSYG